MNEKVKMRVCDIQPNITTAADNSIHVSRKRFELKVIIEALFLPISNEDYVAMAHTYTLKIEVSTRVAS